MTAVDRGSAGAEPQPATFVFADLAGYTALTETHGDVPAADLVEEFFAVVRAFLRDYPATEVKTIGDAMMLRVSSAADAVALGLRIMGEVGARHGRPGVRVGMHTGTAIMRDGDWFGAAVNLAARVASLAGDGDVLLTEATRDAGGGLPGVNLDRRGLRGLKNIGRPVMIYAAGGAADRTDDGLPIDPVCRMAVDPERAAGGLSHDGVRYVFCSLRCAGLFARDPDTYVPDGAGRQAGDRGEPNGTLAT